ncbi:hypothetical protein AV929_16355 [Haloarcula sp. K1]|nr:hypothetical protein AV929_16355 [Haloarcula sp. K1]
MEYVVGLCSREKTVTGNVGVTGAVEVNDVRFDVGAIVDFIYSSGAFEVGSLSANEHTVGLFDVCMFVSSGVGNHL